MITDTSIPMPIAALAFLAALGGTALAVISGSVLLFLKKHRSAALVAAAWSACACVYMLTIVAFSSTSQETTLAIGQEKHFCEIDCHIAQSVVSATRTDASHLLVTVRTRFDENTIGPHRGDAPLTPNAHKVILRDTTGEHRGQPLPPASAEERDPLAPLRPGEHYLTRYLFETTSAPASARLFIGNTGMPERVIIGNEASLAHKKFYFAL